MSDNNHCNNRRESIAALVLGELQADAAEELKEHISTCQTCRSLYQDLSAEEQTIKSAFATITNKSSTLQRRLVHQYPKEPHPPSRRTITLNLNAIVKSPITKLAVAAVIVVTALIGVKVFNGTPVWAQIVQALNEVKNAHMDVSYTLRDGRTKRHRYWVSRPRRFREILPNGDVIIDNGVERLTIYTERKAAQLSESWQPFHTLAEDAGFKIVDLLREENLPAKFKIDMTKLASESDDERTVYRIDGWGGDEPAEGRMWVDAETLLPERVLLRTHVDTGDEPVYESTVEFKFNYEPMPDEFFSTAIPQGYTELPRIEPFALSGKVVDEQGQVIEVATVLAEYPVWDTTLHAVSNEKGTFVLRPVSKKERIRLPIFLRAFHPEEPARVAWTLLEDPAYPNMKRQLGGDVPGLPGEVEVIRDNTGQKICSGASGIVLQMEPAAEVAGQVTDGQGNPVADVNVHLRCRPSDKEGDPVSGLTLNLGISRTDASGEYILANVPRLWAKCYFRLHFIKEGYWREHSPFKTVGPLESRRVDFKMFRNDVTIVGKAMDDGGRPLAGYGLVLCAENGQRRYSGGVTDAEGHFRLQNCPAASDLKIVFRGMYEDEWELNRKKYDIAGDDEFVYYAETEVAVNYQPGKKEYYVELILEKPDITLEVVLQNTAGEPVRYFSVGAQAEGISHEWRLKKLTRLTDVSGQCIITQLPRVQELKLRLDRVLSKEQEDLLTEQQRNIAEENLKYASMRVPVELVPGEQEYRIEVTLLTKEERRKQRSGE